MTHAKEAPDGGASGRGAPRVPFRVGHGYDLHRLAPLDGDEAGVRAFVLGGVRLEHDRGPVGHSDGDALLHAVTDALLGALGQPDIGQLFPDNDPANEGRDSADFLREAARRVRAQGWQVGNIDCCVILERPRISHAKAQMAANIARLLGVDPSQVNVKGKSHEKVDAVGEGRAVEVHVVALLWRTAGGGSSAELWGAD